MECVELGAMKSFPRPEAAFKMIHQQGCLENEFAAAGNGQGGVGAISGDDLFVDELLDLSNGFVEEEQEEEEEEQKVGDQPLEKREEGAQNLSVTLVSVSPQKQEKEAQTVTFPVTHDFGSLPGSELSVPVSLPFLNLFV